MAKLFGQELSTRRTYEQKYKSSRMNLLMVVILTAINLVLLVTNANSYFLFSAFIPYFIASMGMLLCGRYPQEFYEGEFEELVFFNDTVFIVLLVIAIVITSFYLLAWFLSNKNRVGWLIFALVFFVVDTLGMFVLNGASFEGILDILFHAWVIYDLSRGIVAYYKLKKLPPEEEVTLSQFVEGDGESS